MLHLCLESIRNIAAGLTYIGCLFMIISAWAVMRWRKSPSARASTVCASKTAVSILKPLNGAEPRLFGRLASYCRQNHGAPVQLVFGSLDSKDPALEVVQRLKLAFPEVDIGSVAGGPEFGANRKMSNLINMRGLARHDVLMLSDSDILVKSDHVTSVVAALAEPGVGAVTCLYHGLPSGSMSSHLSALAINTHFLPEVLLAISFNIARPCFGATICLRSETLERAGGLISLANVLADDYLLGEAVRKLGERVEIAPSSVGHVCFEGSLRELLQRQLRVACTIKSIDQLGYFGSVITHPFAWSLLAALCGKGLALVLAAIGSRLAVAIAVEHKFAVPRQRYWLIPLHDLLSFGVFIASLKESAVVWRGTRLRVRMRDGRLFRDGESP